MNKSKQKKYEEELLNAIRKFKWMRWSHIDWEALSFSKATAYNYKLEELDTIKEAFALNRSKATNYMLQKWIASDNPTLQIAAMRIIADDEDRLRLNQQYMEMVHKQEIKPEQLLPVDLREKVLKNLQDDELKRSVDENQEP